MPLVSCRICGARVSSRAKQCPVCLEREPVPPRRERFRWRLVSSVVGPVLFVATCAQLLAPAARVVDPMTHIPVGSMPEEAFPVLVMRVGVPHVALVRDVRALPPLLPGESYLVPDGEDERIEQKLRAAQQGERFGVWKLRVQRLAAGRQEIELFWASDGYHGGGYEATATAVAPKYRKVTGPGFALFFGGLALLVNIVLWSPVVLLAWLLQQRR
jgi:hypothetical protein